MFTYRENRVLSIEEGQLSFPCDALATIKLCPSPVHGDAVPGMTSAVNSQARIEWNANTGSVLVESSPPLPATAVRRAVGSLDLLVAGNVVEARWRCSSREELVHTLGALHFVLPLSLSLGFVDAVLPAVTSGRAGNAAFVWQVEGTGGYFEAVDARDRDDRMLRAIDLAPVLCEPRNIRLLAAVAYFQKAARLLVVGLGPSEFAGEAVVNLAKCLEVLFPAPPSETRDAARRGLARLGYARETVEGVFIKALLLRSSLDGAHVRMATLAADERRNVQVYMEGVIGEFRTLLREVADRIARHELDLAPYENERSSGDDLARLLDDISSQVESVDSSRDRPPQSDRP